MIARILSLNIGAPAAMEWNGQSVVSSMLRHPVPGPIVVHEDCIEGNAFGAPQLHGLEHAVLYAYGMQSALTFVRRLGLEAYEPGSVGENLTLDHLDEAEVSVGDIFDIGEVRIQAVYPRVPCGKVNFRMRHAEGQKAMQACGRSGIYFRVLRAGKIHRTDIVRLAVRAEHRFPIADLYRKMVAGEQLTRREMELALRNGAFPKKAIEKWAAALASP